MWQKINTQRPYHSIPLSRISLEGPTVSELKDIPVEQRESVNARIALIDASYKPFKSQLEHSIATLDKEKLTCHCCNDKLDHEKMLTLVCSHEECDGLFHLTCLSKAFLGETDDLMIPTNHPCPKCKRQLSWMDLVKDLSLRIRGEKEMKSLMKKPRKKANSAVVEQTQVVDDEGDLLSELSDLSDIDDSDVEEDLHIPQSESSGLAALKVRAQMMDEDTIIANPLPSVAKHGSAKFRSQSQSQDVYEIVDSEDEWAGADVVD